MPKRSASQQLNDIIEMIQDAYAPNTVRAYRADMEEFILYCKGVRKSALPANPVTIAEFLMSTTKAGIRSATIRRKVASISAIHRFGEYGDPTKHSQVKLAIRKIHRQLGTRHKQAYPITESVLKQLIAVCDDDLRGLRNKALLMLAYDSMRRRSELVSLRAEDLEINDSGLISILLRKSKTDQEATGQWIHLGLAATKALEIWLKTAQIHDGYILRGISPTDEIQDELSDGQIGRIFKSLAKKAGLCSEAILGVSGHSMRVGGAQDLLIKGASLPQIMVKGGWIKTDTVMRYIERVKNIAFLRE